MNKLNILSWKKFKISEIFSIKPPASRSEKKYVKGNVPYVSSGAFNNGICNYLEPKGVNDIEKGNCISVSPLDGSSFYQENDFLGRGGSGASIQLLYNDNLNKYNALFICTIIKKSSNSFGYTDLLNGNNLKNLEIYLPVKSDGSIDWEYMKKYMLVQEEKARLNIIKYSLIKNDNSKIKSDDWKVFNIVDLFEVNNTNSILKSWITENSGSDPYVTASRENNGVYTFVDYKKDKIEKGNCLLIGGKTLVITYQPNDFYSNDSHNLALYLKDTKYRTKNIQLFLSVALKASLKNKYSWGNSISKNSIKSDIIVLPVDSIGNPDYNYMNNFINKIVLESKNKFEIL